ncbi:N-acetylmuramoyl-L-alanine amidase [Oceanobacillus sp. M60]|uniref:N-acetylmuramoyl-L-alanine amidase AmiA n=1 Tax=Oceanobacillus oncorhynchi TaxID=545501 RepID=A0A0A1MLT9_9BACI|nr:N-acetylmuramoyl-L-alanine amidase [Oceanobacillus oncorhynchi]UUI39717.1 N-acetylmuramoyl-L-alanine amidase [Oceanobacillus oncorhynchi]CEI80647.1 N-acetylmuramoyl-L-alanine amidase AmiA precursor [Oceanobacillus oncorhynchi]
MEKKTKKIYLLAAILFILSFFLPNASLANGDSYEVSSAVLNIRSEPSNDASLVGQFTKGDKVNAFDEQHGWVQTYYGGEPVWVAKHHLISTGDSSQEAAPAAEETVNEEPAAEPAVNSSGSVTVSADSIYVRSGPSTSDTIISYAYQGDSFDVNAASGDWIEISLGNGETGWIASWLTTDGSSNEEATENTAPTVEAAQTQSSSSGSLSGHTIVIDPGHGGKDPGAIGLNNIYEKDVVTSTADYVVQQLEEAGANVIVTRNGDYFVSLDERARISNSYNTDAFISLHYDSFSAVPVSGVTTYYNSDSDTALASSLNSTLSSTVSLPSRGTQQAGYKVLENTNAPSVLIELGYITNPHDLTVVQTGDYQSSVARAITNGLINHLN